MEIRLLGPVELVGGDGVRHAVGVKQRVLLAALAVSAGREVSTDQLVEVLWGHSPPAGAANTLQAHVARLRKLFGADRDRLVTGPSGYRLELRPGELDVGVFERFAEEG